MSTILLLFAGVGCVAAALGHGYLGQTRLIGPAQFPGRQAKALVSLIWMFSAVAWAACGLLIAVSPWLFDDRSRPFAVMLACLPLCWGIIGNAWITRGRHFGWKLFAIVVVIAMVGVLLPR